MENLRLNRDAFEHPDLRRSTIDGHSHSDFIEKSMNERRIFDSFNDDVVMKISDLKQKYPWMYPWQIRKRLLQDPDLITLNLPSIAGVEWILRFLSNYQENSSISSQFMSYNDKHDDLHVDNIDKTKLIAPVTHSSNNDTVDCNSLTKRTHQTSDGQVLKKRRQRVNFTSDEVHILEKEFQRSHYPDHGHLAKLAKLLNGEVYRIQVWFANRRAKSRRLTKQKKAIIEKQNPFVILPVPSTSSDFESERGVHSFSSSDNELMDMPERVSTSLMYIVNSPPNHRLCSDRVYDDDLQYSFLPKHSDISIDYHR